MSTLRDIKVNEIFYSIQGEGPLVGTPTVFIRLSGCNLSCSFCDSKYHVNGDFMSPQNIADIALSYKRARNICITGGEPLIQQDKLKHLRDELMLRSNNHIEIETNGIEAPLICLSDRTVSYNVSPKLSNSGMSLERRYKPDILEYHVKECQSIFKFVVSAKNDIDEILNIIAENSIPANKVYLMPEGVTREAIISKSEWIAALCLSHGWNFTSRLQTIIWGNRRGV